MSRLNKRLLIIIVIIGLISGSISGCINKEKEEGIVAKVDGEIITQEEFDEDFDFAKGPSKAIWRRYFVSRDGK